MGELVFTSLLEISKRDAFEEIFHHNANQYKMLEAITAVIERYGEPAISSRNGRLWVTFKSGCESQTLFALEQTPAGQELAGVIVYTRERDELVVLFAAVRPEYAQGGEKGERRIFLRMIDEVRNIARRVKGVKSVMFFTHDGKTLRLKP
jgi:hypothetical protein